MSIEALINDLGTLRIGSAKSQAAAKALVDAGLPAVEPLLIVFKDKKEGIDKRGDAAVVLGMIGGPQVIDALMTALEEEDDYTVQKNAQEILRQIGDARVVDRLIVLLRGEDRGRKIHAAYILGGIGDTRAVEPLIVALEERDDSIAKAAAKALGEIGDLRAAEPLVAAFGRTKDIRDNASEALAKMGPSAMDAIIAGLKHPDDMLRGNVAMLLAKIGDGRAIEPLRAALDDKVGRVRMLAENALERIEGRIT